MLATIPWARIPHNRAIDAVPQIASCQTASAHYSQPQHYRVLGFHRAIGHGENAEIGVANYHRPGWQPTDGCVQQLLFTHRIGTVHGPEFRPHGQPCMQIVCHENP